MLRLQQIAEDIIFDSIDIGDEIEYHEFEEYNRFCKTKKVEKKDIQNGNPIIAYRSDDGSLFYSSMNLFIQTNKDEKTYFRVKPIEKRDSWEKLCSDNIAKMQKIVGCEADEDVFEVMKKKIEEYKRIAKQLEETNKKVAVLDNIIKREACKTI